MHADDIDNAAELEMLNIEIALANRPRPNMTFTGICQNGDCGEKLEKGFFCCPEARMTMSALSAPSSIGELHEAD